MPHEYAPSVSTTGQKRSRLHFWEIMDLERIQSDFDEIAAVVEAHESGVSSFDPFLQSLVPERARSVLDVGCGLGRLTAKLARTDRQVTGIDLSTEMIARAVRSAAGTHGVSFLAGNFLSMDFGEPVDCVITAATLHHMPCPDAVLRMANLVRDGGRLIIHDLRSTEGIREWLQAHGSLGVQAMQRFARTGRFLSPKPVRDVWRRHGADERYMTTNEVRELASTYLPGSNVTIHWHWRYTIVWDKPNP